MSDDVKPIGEEKPIDDEARPPFESKEYVDKVKAEAEVYFAKIALAPSEPAEKVVARGFTEACVDLGDGQEPSPKIVDALEGLRQLTDGGLSFTVLSKTTGPGFYAHVLFDSIARFKAISAERDMSLFAAIAFEDWPAYALRADGGRAHVFAGVGDVNERKPG